jgi:hypothetical protein
MSEDEKLLVIKYKKFKWSGASAGCGISAQCEEPLFDSQKTVDIARVSISL